MLHSDSTKKRLASEVNDINIINQKFKKIKIDQDNNSIQMHNNQITKFTDISHLATTSKNKIDYNQISDTDILSELNIQNSEYITYVDNNLNESILHLKNNLQIEFIKGLVSLEAVNQQINNFTNNNINPNKISNFKDKILVVDIVLDSFIASIEKYISRLQESKNKIAHMQNRNNITD